MSSSKERVSAVAPAMVDKAVTDCSYDLAKAHIHFTLGDTYLERAYDRLTAINMTGQNVKHWGKTCLKAFDNFNKEVEAVIFSKMTSDAWKLYNDDFEQNMQIQKDWTDGKIIVVRPMPDADVEEAVKKLKESGEASDDVIEGFKAGVEWVRLKYNEMGGRPLPTAEDGKENK